MNPHDKELSAALAYNRFMERRVLQLESEVRSSRESTERYGNSTPKAPQQSSPHHHSGFNVTSTRQPSPAGYAPDYHVPTSRPPLSGWPEPEIYHNNAAAPSSPTGYNNSQSARSATRQPDSNPQRYDGGGGSTLRTVSVTSMGSSLAAPPPTGKMTTLEGPTNAYAPIPHHQAPPTSYAPPPPQSSVFDGIGGMDALVEELLRLRNEQERLTSLLTEKDDTIHTLQEEARQATLREGQASVRIQELLQELVEIRELLPEKLFGEKKEDDRRIKDILMVARQVQQQDSRYTKGSSLAVAHHMIGEVEKHRTPQRTLRAMERANQASTDPNWRFMGAVAHMSEMGASRELIIYEEAQSAINNILASMKAFDETASLYNVTGRHSVAVVVEAQGATGDECMVVRRKADTFLSSMEALRVSRQESLITAASAFPTVGILIRRLNNALLGASVRRVMKFAPALMARLEELANTVEQYDLKTIVGDSGIPVSPAEQALRLHSTKPPQDHDEQALTVQLWSTSTHEVDASRLESTEFRRIEVQDIKELASQNVSVDPSAMKVTTLLDQVKELLEKVHNVVQGTDDEDGVGNQTNSKSVQCTLLGIRRQTTDAEDQYERLLHSFLQARSVERDALLELRKKAVEREDCKPIPDERKPWNFHTPGGPKAGKFEPLDGAALDSKIREIAEARILARRERARGGPISAKVKREDKAADEQFEKELEAQLASLS